MFTRDNSHRLAFELLNASSDAFPAISKAITTSFNLAMDSELVVGLELMSWKWRQEDRSIELAWDNWSGFVVTAVDERAEPLVTEIGTWLLESEWADS